MPPDRLLSNWIADYLEFTSEQESPESLHLWTAISVLSAALRRRVWIEHEYYTIFPNIYVIIVAASARVRKSTAMDIGRDIFLKALPDASVFRDSGTAQGLIKMLNKPMKIQKGDVLAEEQQSPVAIFADEVANLFSYEKGRASTMVIFLTRTYGCPSVYDHTTVRDSVVRLHNLYPTLLGGTDPHNLKVLPEDAVGGLTGRLMWVIESQRRTDNPGWKKKDGTSTKRRLLYEALIHDLRVVSSLYGEVEVTDDAQALYNKWYRGLSQRDTKDPEADAFFQRCHTTAIKLSMIISIAQSNSLIVNAPQMEAAIALIEAQLPAIKRVTMWSGTSIFEQLRAKFFHFIAKTGGACTRRAALKHLGVSADDFDKLIATLIQDGSLHVPAKLGSEIGLQLTKEGFERAITTGNQQNGQT